MSPTYVYCLFLSVLLILYFVSIFCCLFFNFFLGFEDSQSSLWYRWGNGWAVMKSLRIKFLVKTSRTFRGTAGVSINGTQIVLLARVVPWKNLSWKWTYKRRRNVAQIDYSMIWLDVKMIMLRIFEINYWLTKKQDCYLFTILQCLLEQWPLLNI